MHGIHNTADGNVEHRHAGVKEFPHGTGNGSVKFADAIVIVGESLIKRGDAEGFGTSIGGSKGQKSLNGIIDGDPRMRLIVKGRGDVMNQQRASKKGRSVAN